MKICPICNEVYTDNDYYCLKDNYKLKHYSDEQCFMEQDKQREKEQLINIPKCPTCQSTKIKKISTATKAVHGFAFGLFSKTVHCQFECLNCHYKW